MWLAPPKIKPFLILEDKNRNKIQPVFLNLLKARPAARKHAFLDKVCLFNYGKPALSTG
jgi:hypothetical protein